MAYTSSDLARVEAAISSGTLRVKDASGNEVWYQSINELQALRRQILAELANAGTNKPSVARSQLADFSSDA